MKENEEDIVYQIALLEMMHVGPRVARKIINCFGSAQAVIKASEEDLKEVGEIGRKIISQREDPDFMNFAKAQLEFCDGKGAQVLSYYSKQYPYRLKQCVDAPQILYQMGHCDLNARRMVAIVGTRSCSSYGREICENLVKGLKEYGATIVSGLAFGIDSSAHQSAVQNEMYNIGVVAHGLDRIYPAEHVGLANQMVMKGAILTEFPTKTNPDRENFPKRNRIVAGMVDAVIVVESAIKGGSMITARLGNDYSRDVFAVPGRLGSEFSKGCNHLIKTNQAHLLESAEDIAYILGWQKDNKQKKAIQKEIKFDLSESEKAIISAIGSEVKPLDEIALISKMKVNEVSTQLLLLELNGVVKQLPGKKFQVA